MNFLLKLMKPSVFVIIPIFISHCATEQSIQSFAQISIYNTGTFAMQSPMTCYYQESDQKKCVEFDPEVTSIAPGERRNFSIKANQKVRLVFPFDTTLKSSNIVYRPNCHILSDFFVFEEKQYLAEAQIIANASKLENGFNCALKMFEQNISSTEKAPMNESASTYIRYRVPPKGKFPAGYISNYNWQ